MPGGALRHDCEEDESRALRRRASCPTGLITGYVFRVRMSISARRFSPGYFTRFRCQNLRLPSSEAQRSVIPSARLPGLRFTALRCVRAGSATSHEMEQAATERRRDQSPQLGVTALDGEYLVEKGRLLGQRGEGAPAEAGVACQSQCGFGQ